MRPFQCILNPILNDHIFFEDQIMLLWPEALLACLTSKLVVISGRHIVAQSGTTIFLVCVAILKGIISSTLQQSNILSSLSRLTLVFLTCWRDQRESISLGCPEKHSYPIKVSISYLKLLKLAQPQCTALFSVKINKCYLKEIGIRKHFIIEKSAKIGKSEKSFINAIQPFWCPKTIYPGFNCFPWLLSSSYAHINRSNSREATSV